MECFLFVVVDKKIRMKFLSKNLFFRLNVPFVHNFNAITKNHFYPLVSEFWRRKREGRERERERKKREGREKEERREKVGREKEWVLLK